MLSITSAQRRQSAGCAATWPTSSSTRQQRAHLWPGAVSILDSGWVVSSSARPRATKPDTGVGSVETVARDTIADVEASGLWPGRVVTEVSPIGDFWQAEPEHQDYLERIPNGYTCHFVRPGWTLPHRAQAAERPVGANA